MLCCALLAKVLGSPRKAAEGLESVGLDNGLQTVVQLSPEWCWSFQMYVTLVMMAVMRLMIKSTKRITTYHFLNKLLSYPACRCCCLGLKNNDEYEDHNQRKKLWWYWRHWPDIFASTCTVISFWVALLHVSYFSALSSANISLL